MHMLMVCSLVTEERQYGDMKVEPQKLSRMNQSVSKFGAPQFSGPDCLNVSYYPMDLS